jgi:hypothetical protein
MTPSLAARRDFPWRQSGRWSRLKFFVGRPITLLGYCAIESACNGLASSLLFLLFQVRSADRATKEGP